MEKENNLFIFFKEFSEFSKTLYFYIIQKIKQFGLFIESIKNIVIAILVAKRGKYSTTFLNTIFFFLTIIIYSLSPIISENNPFTKKEKFNTENTLALEYKPEEASIITDISVKPRDRIIKYQVKPGDTLSSIAKKFNIDVNSIKWLNKLKTDTVKSGQILDIPPITGVVHTVKTGETIYSIAKKYKVDPQNIVNFPFNEFENEETFALRPGQILYIPNGVIEEEKARPIYIAEKTTPIQAGVKTSSNFIWPTSGRITQYAVPYHMALDIANKSAPNILAADSGKVVYSGCLRYGYGCHIIIDHGNGFKTLYAHMSQLYVSSGTSVSQGQAIGRMGSTGRSTGTHLHFEIIYQGIRRNPLSYLK